MMNNYFPALEAGALGTSEEMPIHTTKDQRYPKFSHEIVNNPAMLNAAALMNQQDPIDEVPPEQEEGESQENIQKMPNFYPQQD